MFKGLITAIITPFKNGKIDYLAFERLIEAQIAGGVDGILPCGTTGESPTLSDAEHNELVRFVVDRVNKRVLVLAGTGSNSTADAINFSMHAEKVGADGVLVVSPYYNKPTQEGLYRHFSSIATSISIPIILYNIPGRTAVNISAFTMQRLSKEHKNIVGVKESAGSLSQAMEIVDSCGSNFALISGDDLLTIPLYSIGACGIISVLSNIIPKEVSKIVSHCNNGEYKEASALHYKYLGLINALFIESNPAPVKEALSLMGICSNEVRLPITNISSSSLEYLRATLSKSGVLKTP